MNAEEVLNRENFKHCLEFHGHLCPGVSIGYRAARAAMDFLTAQRSEDEEVVAVVETDACSADAVQVLTMETEALFKIEPARVDLPPKARIAPSEPCAVCGEPTMATKMEEVEGRRLCRDCFRRER